MALFKAATPRVFNIPAGVAFAEALAGAIERETRGDPAAVAGYLLLVPNRRSVRALREAFLRASGGQPRILPEIRALGDVSEDDLLFEPAFGVRGSTLEMAPPISRLRRLLLLGRQVREAAPGLGQTGMPASSALHLASELARLLDEMQTEGIAAGALVDLAPERFAAHWQEVLRFLEIITRHWPAILEADGHSDIADHRNRLLRSLAKAWEETPPERTVIAAGSTGSLPPTAELLRVISRFERGAVVLPGLDLEAPEEVWAAVDDSHPQFMMKQLLGRMQIDRGEVRDWPLMPASKKELAAKKARMKLVSAALRPADTIAAWRELKPGLNLKAAFRNVFRIDCAGRREEAGVIALLMRETLETKERTAALVTPDRRLAREVRTELERWDIHIDDSAGTPLAMTAVGSFFLLLAQSVAEDHAPVPFLSLLKHPLAAAGLDRKAFLDELRGLEVEALRGPRPGGGLKGLSRALAGGGKERRRARAFLKKLTVALAPLEKLRSRKNPSLGELVTAHIEAAVALAASAGRAGAENLWSGQEGEALAAFIEELSASAGVFGQLPGEDYAALITQLMEGRVVRPRYGRHPRLSIWGPLEARMQSADRMIIGGLNEGVWPPTPADDPWMSRPMRADLNLPPAERRVGQSAHDFVEAMGAAEVYLTRSQKIDGAPSVPSRWLLRLEALAGSLPKGPRPLQRWFHELDRPERVFSPGPPRPTPPLKARPSRLSVTGIENWMRDPYAIYAGRILRLKSPDPIDQAPGAQDRGIVIHQTFETFLKGYNGPWDEEALEKLLAVGRQAFEGVIVHPGVWAFWWPRFKASAARFIEIQSRRADGFKVVGTEVDGKLDLTGLPVPFLLTAKADRIDRETETGSLVIIDYKTGAVPSARRIAAGFAPQLPLEALMAVEGAFTGIPAAAVSAIEYWQISGGRPPITIKQPRLDLEAEVARSEAGLRALITTFADEKTPYLSNPRPLYAGYGDFDHLARVREWRYAVPGGEEGEGER